jgi:peroxiredoxin
VLPLLIAIALPLRAADPHPGHSLYGEAFNEGPRQAAVLMGGTGRVKFPITTESGEARKFFEQGVGQLHGFWYLEAERSFRQASALDPEAAMPYWGMAMANVNNEKRAKEFLRKAVALKDKADARERLWITTLENYYREEKKEKMDRELGFIRDLEVIVQEHPADIEAKAFLVWKIWHAKKDAPISSFQAVDALLDQIFAAEPMHPAHHYRIHLWDDSKPVRALKSAAQNGQTAPSIAHMWHMPGHTFSKLKRHDDAAWQQEASTRVDHAHQIANLILPDQIHNYAHNEEWLVRTFNELGRAQDAAALARSLIEVPRHPDYNTLDKSGCTASFGRTRLIETRVKWEQWRELLRDTAAPLMDDVPQTSHEITRHHARGLAQFHLEQGRELAATISTLEAIEKKEKNKPKTDRKGNTAAKTTAGAKEEVRKAVPAGKPATVAKSDAGKARAVGNKPATPQATPLQSALGELRALTLILKNDRLAAIKTLGTPGDIPKERLARYWLRLGDKKKAEELVKNFPQDLAGLGAKAEVLLACGKKAEAKAALEAAGEAAFAMDRDLPLAKRLDDIAVKLQVQGDWRAPAPKRPDSGTRPDIATLGPIHWQPPAVRPWSALTPEGKTVTERDYAGRPVLMLFYLGHVCSGCMEQLNAIAAAAPQFKEAGIQIIAISPDKPQDLMKATDSAKDKKPFPFPLLSDEKMTALKTYRAYDDFEKMGLHGLFLCDAAGKLRWFDIGYRPFLDTAFLVKEAKRLLNLPPHTVRDTHAAR